MDLPTSRELELEILLRERDAQVAELGDEVNHLRRYLSCQPGPSTSDPVTLPPTLVSVLLPRINNASSSGADATTSNSSVMAALTQRARLLQEENDELYELLKHGEIGLMKEEVHGLRRAVLRLESALRESHRVIHSLSVELDGSRECILSLQQNNRAKGYVHHPRNSYHPRPMPTRSSLGGNGTRPPPTGPRAQKKPRLSEPPHGSRSSRTSTSANTTKMNIEEDQRKRPRSVDRERRDKREGQRERDRERSSRRNGHLNRERSGDRTLAERMGL